MEPVLNFTNVCAGVTVLAVLFRVWDSFASKKETKATADALQTTVDQHRIDAKKMLEDQTYALRTTMRENAAATDKALGEVLKQAEKTNGRVTELERWQIREQAGKEALAQFAATAIANSMKPPKAPRRKP